MRPLLSFLGLVAALAFPAGAAEPPTAGAESARVLRLAAGDRIVVELGGPTGLAGTFTLGAGGELDMPGVGTVEAWGEPPAAIARLLADALARGGRERPQVTVRLADPRPVYVLGAVARPGRYPYQADMTVDEALDAAGGMVQSPAHVPIRIRAGGSNARAVPADAGTALLPGDIVEIDSP